MTIPKTPWYIDPKGYIGRPEIRDNNNQLVCLVEQRSDHPMVEHHETTSAAKLIEAATILYSDLMAVRPLFLSMFECYSVWRDQLREGKIPKPISAYKHEDDLVLQTIDRITKTLNSLDI